MASRHTISVDFQAGLSLKFNIMAKDWVVKYLADHDRHAQVQDVQAQRLELAKAGADCFFRSFYNQVRMDVEAFNRARREAELNEQLISSCSFIVRRSYFPSAQLQVTREEIYINYVYKFTPDHASESRIEEGQLILFADSQGRINAKHNGEPFADYGEISEFLIRPIFDYVLKD